MDSQVPLPVPVPGSMGVADSDEEDERGGLPLPVLSLRPPRPPSGYDDTPILSGPLKPSAGPCAPSSLLRRRWPDPEPEPASVSPVASCSSNRPRDRLGGLELRSAPVPVPVFVTTVARGLTGAASMLSASADRCTSVGAKPDIARCRGTAAWGAWPLASMPVPVPVPYVGGGSWNASTV